MHSVSGKYDTLKQRSSLQTVPDTIMTYMSYTQTVDMNETDT